MKSIARVVAVLIAAAALPALAQQYPTKPVRAIIAFPAGSATDIIGRIIVQKVSEYWGQQIIADNRGGAGGSIASAIAARAAPDGYTLIINSGAHTVNPSSYIKLPYDTLKDFIDITPLVGMPNVLIVHPSSPHKTFGDFLGYAKSNPGKINFAFAGIGSGTHLNTEKFKLASNIDVTMVSYKGTAEAIIDVMGGRVDTYFTPMSAALPFVKSGKVRALAVTTAKRSAQLPDVPTMAESGVPKFEFILWFGLWGPTGIPAPIVSKVYKDFNRAMADPGIREKLINLGNDTLNMTHAEFRKFVRDEIAVTQKIFKAAGIKPQ
ncbi:MAG: tripartite tricarboxylate transporter substrate binding protein [Betaproteobacteria bacterium]|nr:tripartite tricarboxylate transporter substrate binding protein [Betaproteobacteria bacterium]